MLRYDATKSFWKQYQKLSPKTQSQFDTRLKLFIVDQANPKLKSHPLKGKYKGYWSINITGDIRALYCWEADELIIFTHIGTHSALYG